MPSELQLVQERAAAAEAQARYFLDMLKYREAESVKREREWLDYVAPFLKPRE